MTILVMLLCARIAQAVSSYKAAETLMADAFRMRVSATSIERVTNYVGEHVYETDKERSVKAYEEMPHLGYEENSRKGVFYIMMDGGVALTREKGVDGSGWKEVRLVMCFSDEDLKQRGKDKNGEPCYSILKKEYVPYLGSAEDFKKFVWDMATRNHCFEYEKIVIISDGATWIRSMCNELFPGSQRQ
jgi:hypothetical protein